MAIQVQKLQTIQTNTANIRNICIMAHVDHGKTTLSDSLVASNGIISTRLAGQMRYLDFRKDEQERGITMESSNISLLFNVLTKFDKPPGEEGKDEKLAEYLINLIDCPGHVDFVSEVTASSRLCDGCLILIDVVEGVCTQTISALKQSRKEKIKPILVLNKLDRLITTMKLTTEEAYLEIRNIVEQVNVLIAGFIKDENIELEDKLGSELKDNITKEDSEDYFSPEKGNVLFMSAYDGWAFRTSTFADIYAKKLGTRKDLINKFLWGEYYYNKKTGKILTQKQAKKMGLLDSQPIMFIDFILNNIWKIYDAVIINNNQEKIKRIVNSLNIKVLERDTKSKSTKQILNTIFRQWLPISNCVLYTIVELIPSPLKSKNRLEDFEINKETVLYNNATKCSHEGDVIAYISKTFYVDKSDLKCKDILLSAEMLNLDKKIDELNSDHSHETTTPAENGSDLELMGIARIYCGTIKKGQKLYLLGPKYTKGNSAHVFEVTVTGLFIIMGKDLNPIDEVCAGNIFGITGLRNFVNKYATLSSTLECPNLCLDNKTHPPIMKVAIEPLNPSDVDKLEAGLKLLGLSDPVAEITFNKNGEFILSTAGELHLERCLTDLRERFINIEIQISDPIVPFRETIIYPNSDHQISNEKTCKNTGYAEIAILDKALKIKLRIVPLIQEVVEFLQLHTKTIKKLYIEANESAHTETSTDIAEGIDQKPMTYDQFFKYLKELNPNNDPYWADTVEKIWSFGPNRTGPNILVNNMEFSSKRFCEDCVITDKHLFVNDTVISLKQIEDTINNSFQLFTANGPMCMEPVYGVCCIINDITINNEPIKFSTLKEEDNTAIFDYRKNSLVIGGLISEFKEACKLAFCEWPQRLMLAMFECNILTTIDVLGKVYHVINQRRGHIISEEVKDGSTMYSIKAHLPVIESFKFGEEIYKRTSGLAFPHLYFKGFKVLDIDPNWVPTTKDEIEEFGDNLERANISRKYINDVRKKKGLLVEERMIVNAEKQRTLKK